MTRPKIKAMILKIIERLDYDHYKFFLPECSEDPDAAEELMGELVEIVEKHLSKR